MTRRAAKQFSARQARRLPRYRLAEAVRSLAALVTLAGLTIGLPVLLYRLGGSPIPARLPSIHHLEFLLSHRDDGSLFLGAVRDLSWIAWAAFTLAVITEAQATLRGRTAPRLRLVGIQGLASRLVASATLTFSAPVLAGNAVLSLGATPVLAAATHPVSGRSIQPHERIVVVRAGDCLWTIAQRYLGSGDRYTEIVKLNQGENMGDHERFSNPGVIEPGWQLRVPGSGATEAHRDPSDHTRHAGHPSPDRRYRRPHSGAGHAARQTRGHGPPGAATRSTSGVGESAGATGSSQVPGSEAAALHGHDAQFNEAAMFTLGMLAGGALASLQRLRHRQRQHRRPGRRIALPTSLAGKLIERKLRAAVAQASSTTGPVTSSRGQRASGNVEAPATLAEALRQLSNGIAAAGEPLPAIVGIHLTADTVEVLLSAPASGPPPAPFVIAPARQAMCWTTRLVGRVSAADIQPPAPGEVGDLLPGLFTVGATEGGGYLLLDLEAMRVTSCDGLADLTDRLLVTAATELASSRWSGWYDLLLVGCDELEVLGRAELCRDLDEALDALEDRMASVARRLDDSGPPEVRTRRLADPEDEDWGLALLVSRFEPTPAQMSRLLDLADGPGGIAALVAGDTQTNDGRLAPAVLELAPDPDRPGQMVATVSLAYLGPEHRITVFPQTLTVSEYEALAGVLETAAQTADVSADVEPYDDYGGPPWATLAAAPVHADPDHYYPPPPFTSTGSDAPVVADAEPFLRGSGSPEPAEALARGRDGEQAEPDAGPAPTSVVADGLRSLGHPPRHAAPSLRVNVLGPVEITGAAEPLLPKQAELVLALALHAPVGLSSSALCTLLGPDGDHPRPADAVRQLITRTRRRLGQASDGQEFIVHLGSGIYVLHADVRLDWTVFSALVKRGRAGHNMASMRAAIAMVKGQPFADCYHWWIEIGLIETMRAEIVDAAEWLANAELDAADPKAAARAARAGLAAESASEQLWRALMRAEHAASNRAGVIQAWTGCLDAISEIAPGADPHPDTERLYRTLTSATTPVVAGR